MEVHEWAEMVFNGIINQMDYVNGVAETVVNISEQEKDWLNKYLSENAAWEHDDHDSQFTHGDTWTEIKAYPTLSLVVFIGRKPGGKWIMAVSNTVGQ